jgi:hypothetical protein
VLRVTASARRSPATVVRGVLDARGIVVTGPLDARPTVEDAFVSMVREDERARRGKLA